MSSPSFASYIADWRNHLKLIGCAGLVLGGFWTFNTIHDLRQELRTQQQVTSTLNQQLQHFPGSTSVVTQNEQQTQSQVEHEATGDFGAAVTAAMKQQDATIQSLTTALGQIQASQTAQPTPSMPAFTPQTVAAGKLTGYTLEEPRDGKPALSSIDIFYDPSKPNPQQAFAGTTWTHYGEQFDATVGNWQRQKDGGLRTTVKLSRTVTKPDPTDPTKTITVGTEDIPLGTASTIYTPRGIVADSPFSLPRWTLEAGISHSADHGYEPAATIDYRLFDRYGVFAGAANGALVGGISIRLGH